MTHFLLSQAQLRLLFWTVVIAFLYCPLTNAQNDWPNQPVYTNQQPTLNAPVNNPFQQAAQWPIQEASQEPVQQSVQQPMAASQPVELPSTERVEPKSPEDLTKDLAAKAEAKATEAKNLFELAIQGNRNAQIKLATDFLKPIVIFIVVMVLASWIGSYLGRMVTNFASVRVDITIGRFAGKLTKFAVMLAAFVGLLGPTAAVFTGILAGLVFAIGMALQGTLGNFAAGIALLIFRPFRVGDYIIVSGQEGKVEAIELFTTTLNTLDNRHIIVPNGEVFGSKIENWSHNAERRVDVLVGVSYAADMKQTRQVLANALQHIDGALTERGIQVYLRELNASSVDWSCRVWCRNEDYLAVRERVTEAVKTSLDQNGISIPFPQLDLHVVTPGSQQKIAA